MLTSVEERVMEQVRGFFTVLDHFGESKEMAVNPQTHRSLLIAPNLMKRSLLEQLEQLFTSLRGTILGAFLTHRFTESDGTWGN
jgi:hypothetical protein